MEDIELGQIREVNDEFGIPTVLCPQNLESLTRNLAIVSDRRDSWRSKIGMYGVGMDFVCELEAMKLYHQRLLISKTETALVAGLGIESDYYPYLPVGEIRDGSMRVRARRSQEVQDLGLFVFLGSMHYPTRRSLEWLLEQIGQHGLPPGARVIVVGDRVDQIASRHRVPDGVEVRGWVDQHALEDLLVKAHAMLIPQILGFGALTRLTELACAGIPIITSGLPTYAIDAPPGLRVVNNESGAWTAALQQFMDEPQSGKEVQYSAWESRQPRTLCTALEKYVNGV